jgi:LysM repeat protein
VKQEHQQMEQVRRIDGRWSPWMPALLASLLLVERLLVNLLGSPAMLLRTLAGLGDARTAEPVVAVVALLGLLVEVLVGYVLIVLVLGLLCALPGAMGRLARRVVPLVTPVAVRRVLELLVGGALLAQATLAVPSSTPSGESRGGPRLTATAMATVLGRMPSDGMHLDPSAVPWWRPVGEQEPVEARPTPRRPAVPPPPWLGGGPSTRAPSQLAPTPSHTTPASGHTVVEGDTLWDIAAARLAPADRSAGRIQRYWRQIYRTNRPAVGADPDLIHPGTRLRVPQFLRDRP